MSNFGEVLYFKKINHVFINDFKLQPDGHITYAGGNAVRHYIMNEKMQVVDSIRPDGYWVDFHEVILREDSTKFLLGIDVRSVDMSQIVPGGQEDATVVGHVIQEMDADNNVIFEWNTWDHFDILDVSDWIDLTASSFDVAHVNTIEIDTDTTMIILSRNMNEVTRIDRRSGEIIWRIGGKNNEFTFIDDTLQWAGPHDIRRIGEGLYSIFDNGRFNTPEPHYSSGVIYEIDEENKTITQMQRFFSDPHVYGAIMGNFDLLDNGHFVTGWGSGPRFDSIAITEFTPDGSVALEMRFNGINYRAHKYNFQPRLFYTLNDTLDFGDVYLTDTVVSLPVYNNSDSTIVLTGFMFRHNLFSYAGEFPLTLPANDSVMLPVKLDPDRLGTYDDVLTYWTQNQDSTERIGRQLHLKAVVVEGFGIDEPHSGSFSISPNPANIEILVQFREFTSGKIELISLNGTVLKAMQLVNAKEVTVNIAGLKPGIYIVRFATSDDHYQVYRKLIINQ